MIKTFINPISKKCRICNQKKLLLEFELDNDTNDKHSNICKQCLTGKDLCTCCIENSIIDTAKPMIELLIDLVKDGMELPDDLISNVTHLSLLSGAKVYCDVCNERLQ